MKQTRLLMGMPITLEIVDEMAMQNDLERIFAYFGEVDETFSTYKATSEISRINRGELSIARASEAVRTVLALCEQTRAETDGYFDIQGPEGIDPSGIVKGWSIHQAAQMLRAKGLRHFYIDAGGDIEVAGCNARGEPWRIGIRNPFNRHENVKILALTDCGVATSGTAIRGQHIYNPYCHGVPLREVVSLTVIAPNVYEADRFATAAFAMGRQGIHFIEERADLEGYLIDAQGQATLTSGLERYVLRKS